MSLPGRETASFMSVLRSGPGNIVPRPAGRAREPGSAKHHAFSSNPSGKAIVMEALIVPVAVFLGFIVLELCLPGRTFPRIGRWQLKGVLFFLLYLAVASTA